MDAQSESRDSPVRKETEISRSDETNNNDDVGKKWYSCTYEGCNFNGKTNAGLERHLKNHSSERMYACTKCETRCTTSAMLNEHMKVHSDLKPFWCLLCEYKCRSKANLRSHLRSHSDERPFACHLCDYKSKTHMNLKNHIRKHTGEKPFSCPACSYRCSTQGSLNVHIRVHTGERPYTCSECSYKSATSGGLKSHYKVHSKEAPFQCKDCPKSFARLSHLRNHSNSHVKDKTYSCSSCNFRSDVPTEINRHIAAHAPGWKDAGNTPGSQQKTRDRDIPGGNPPGILWEDGNNSGLDLIPGTAQRSRFQDPGSKFQIQERVQTRSCSNNSAACSPKSSQTPLKINGESPVFSLPFPFLDRLFPPNHLHEKYWNETGAKPKLNGYLSMFLENTA